MDPKLENSELAYKGQLDAFDLYQLITEDSRRPSSRDGGPALPALGHALAGSVATATSKLLIYPLDLVIARLQVQKQLRKSAKDDGSEYKGVLDAATKIYHHEGGIGAFYTGCAADVTKGIADSFLFFLAYSFLQQYELRRASTKKQQMSVAKEMGIGVAAGAFSKLITTPLQNIITRQQTAALLKAKYTKADGALKQGDALTISDIAKQIYKERGLQGFWAGYSMSLILTLNPAITFAVDNALQKASPIRDAGAHITFLIAAVSKAIATTITYPVSVAKSRAQAMPHPSVSAAEGTDKSRANQKQSSRLLGLFFAQYAVFVSLHKIYQQEGLSGLYSGIEGEVLKGFLSHGLTMMLKDRVHDKIIELYYTLLKVTKQWPEQLHKVQAAAAAVVEDTKKAVVDAGERIENVGVTVVEGGKHALEDGKHAVEHAVGDARERVENVGVTIAEGSKHAFEDSRQAVGHAIGNATQRAENVGVTVVEGSKHALGEARQQVESASASAVETGKNAAAGAGQRIENASVSIAEGSKAAVSDAGQRVENVGVTVMEGGKHAVGDLSKKSE